MDEKVSSVITDVNNVPQDAIEELSNGKGEEDE